MTALEATNASRYSHCARWSALGGEVRARGRRMRRCADGPHSWPKKVRCTTPFHSRHRGLANLPPVWAQVK